MGPSKKQARTCTLKQNTRLQHGSVGYTVKALESVCVCVVCLIVCVRWGALALDKVLCQLSAHWSFHC